jgi:hypothetical protein
VGSRNACGYNKKERSLGRRKLVDGSKENDVFCKRIKVYEICLKDSDHLVAANLVAFIVSFLEILQAMTRGK